MLPWNETKEMEMLLCLSSSVLLRKANTAIINTLSLANLILVKMLPRNYGKPTPFLFASALLRSINIYMCVCLYMCVFVYVFFTASIFNVDESGYRLLSK